MKLSELLDNITVQGMVYIVTFDDDAEIDLFATEDFERDRHNIDEDVLDMEIAYIYPCLNYIDGETPAIKIELHPKEDP